jgi:DNA-binding transcriptional ArsR family regulator
VSLQPDICGNRSGHEANSFLANIRIGPRKQNLRQRIYRSLLEHGEATCEALSLRLNLRYTTVSARLSELKAAAWVMRTGSVAKTRGGTNAAVIRALSSEEREKLLHPKRVKIHRQQGRLFA